MIFILPLSFLAVIAMGIPLGLWVRYWFRRSNGDSWGMIPAFLAPALLLMIVIGALMDANW